MVWNDTRWPPRQEASHPVIDMTPDGRFTAPPAAPSKLMAKITVIAVLVTVVAGAVALAALALWLALTLLPIALGAAAVAYITLRVQAWRRGGGSLGRQRDVFRP